MDYINYRLFLTLCALFFASVCTTALSADSRSSPPIPPRDPSQTINYWKPHSIDPATDKRIAVAKKVFSVLLRTWDTARVEPDLYVVESSAGPWAASLADGNILLSREAIEVCYKYGKQAAEHLLAFILGHELAHQRAEDLWHQKFLRLAGSQAPEIQARLLKDLKINPGTITQLEQREAQADHDGLLIMASVGYDPFKIVDQKDFFTNWVENLWNTSCAGEQDDPTIITACNKAKNRALRTRSQLTRLASQNTLFELGIQSYIAARYEEARKYFIAFGKEFPSHAVFTNIGITYLQQAINIDNRITELDPSRASFMYPIILSDSPISGDITSQQANINKRGATELVIDQLKSKRLEFSELAVKQFEKALRLQPDKRDIYLLIASSYLVAENPFMTRGIIQGKYQPKFGIDVTAEMLLAITSFRENKTNTAIKQLHNAASKIRRQDKQALSADALAYAIAFNHATILKFLNRKEEARTIWTKLAKQAQDNGNGFLFQLALNRIADRSTNSSRNTPGGNKTASLIGKRYTEKTDKQQKNEVWFDGDRLMLVRTRNGDKLVINDESEIISAHNTNINIPGLQDLQLGNSADRPLKLLGVPDRRIHLASGEYLAFDRYSLAVHIMDHRVSGWFLYNR